MKSLLTAVLLFSSTALAQYIVNPPQILTDGGTTAAISYTATGAGGFTATNGSACYTLSDGATWCDTASSGSDSTISGNLTCGSGDAGFGLRVQGGGIWFSNLGVDAGNSDIQQDSSGNLVLQGAGTNAMVRIPIVGGAAVWLGGLPSAPNGYSAVWLTNTTATASNYSVLGDSTNTFLNAPSGTLYFRSGNNTYGTITSSGLKLGTGGPVSEHGYGTCTLASGTCNVDGGVGVAGITSSSICSCSANSTSQTGPGCNAVPAAASVRVYCLTTTSGTAMCTCDN